MARPAGKQRTRNRANSAARAECVCVWWAYWPLAHWTRRQAHVGPAHFRPGPPQPGLLCQAASFSQEEISLLKVERNWKS